MKVKINFSIEIEAFKRDSKFQARIFFSRFGRLGKNATFYTNFVNQFARISACFLWHESGTEQKFFRKTCSEKHFYLGGFFHVAFPPLMLCLHYFLIKSHLRVVEANSI